MHFGSPHFRLGISWKIAESKSIGSGRKVNQTVNRTSKYLGGRIWLVILARFAGFAVARA
jgi:hypothetical protein